MEILTRGKPDEITCENCKSLLKWSPSDLQWTHNEPDYFYLVCPVCGAYMWIERTQELDAQYDAMCNPRYSPYNIP